MTEGMTPLTDDGVEVTEGLRVFTNDWVWGTVTAVCADRSPAMHSFHADHPNDTRNGVEGCWHTVDLDTGYVREYNSDRMTTKSPHGAPYDPTSIS